MTLASPPPTVLLLTKGMGLGGADSSRGRCRHRFVQETGSPPSVGRGGQDASQQTAGLC